MLCVGNPLRVDDGFGYMVYRLLKKLRLPSVYFASTPENVVGVLLDIKPRVVILVDALLGEGTGLVISKLSRMKLLQPQTTHNIPLNLLFRAVGIDPENVLVIGVFVEDLSFGGEPSDRVKRAAEVASSLIWKLLSKNVLPTELKLCDEGSIVPGSIEDLTLVK